MAARAPARANNRNSGAAIAGSGWVWCTIGSPAQEGARRGPRGTVRNAPRAKVAVPGSRAEVPVNASADTRCCGSARLPLQHTLQIAGRSRRERADRVAGAQEVFDGTQSVHAVVGFARDLAITQKIMLCSKGSSGHRHAPRDMLLAQHFKTGQERKPMEQLDGGANLMRNCHQMARAAHANTVEIGHCRATTLLPHWPRDTDRGG
jgi:hypothetical protein